jgi:hypothetical protein
MMYLVGVLLMTVVLPLTSIYAQFSIANTPQSLMMLVGAWFVFWCAGIRLLIDGSLQFFRPKFTSEEIVGIPGDDALPILRELGVVNLAIGLVGVASKVVPEFILPVAIIGAITYGVAGARHAAERGKTGNATAAMVSDLFVSAVLFLYVIYFGLGMVLGLL